MKIYFALVVLLTLLIISGILSVFIPVYFGAGIVFGLAMGAWFYFYLKPNIWRVVLYVAVSCFADFAAMEVFNSGPEVDGFGLMNQSTFISASLTGTIILILFTWGLISRIKIWEGLLVVVLGILAGIWFEKLYSLGPLGLFAAFTQWQILIGLSLGYFAYKHKQTNKDFIESV